MGTSHSPLLQRKYHFDVQCAHVMFVPQLDQQQLVGVMPVPPMIRD